MEKKIFKKSLFNRKGKVQKKDDTKQRDKMTKDGKSGSESLSFGQDGIKWIPSAQHPSWYATNDVELRNIASYPFTERLGDRYLEDSIYQKKPTNMVVPGICAIGYVPSVGYNEERNGALNKAADAFYASVYQGYSSNPTFEAPDLLMYLLAVADINSNIAMLKRAYKIAQKYSNYNRYMGKALVTALGFDYDDLIKNLANTRARINIIQRQMEQSFHIPSNFNWSNRQLYLASHIFRDGVMDKSQIYVFRKDAYFLYSATAVQTGTSIELHPIGWRTEGISQTTYRVDTFINNVINKQILALQGDADVNNMSGAVWKVYGSEGIIHYEELLDGANIDFEYDEMVLHQIHNARAFKPGSSVIGFDKDGCSVKYLPEDGGTKGIFEVGTFIYQTADGTIMSKPVGGVGLEPEWGTGSNNSIACVPQIDSVLIDIHSDNPGPVDFIEATRLAGGLVPTATSANSSPLHCGSEICTGFHLYVYHYSGTYDLHQYVVYSELCIGNTAAADNTDKKLALISNFDWFPIITMGNLPSNADTTYLSNDANTFVGTLGDLENYTIISSKMLATLNDRTFWTLMNIPMFTKSITK